MDMKIRSAVPLGVDKEAWPPHPGLALGVLIPFKENFFYYLSTHQ
jgi:hypothetical protein